MSKGRLIEGYDSVAACLTNAENVSVHIGSMRYLGEVEKWIPGKGIVFRVASMDNNLIKVPNGYAHVQLKVVGRDKSASSFATRIIMKKLPRLLLHFPEREMEKVDRLHNRVYTNISTPIFLKKRAHDTRPVDNTGLGTVENISQGGCSIATGMDLRMGDMINFFLPVNTDGKSFDLDLNGIIRHQDKVPGGMLRVGVQFMNLDRNSHSMMNAYMARRLGQGTSQVSDGGYRLGNSAVAHS